MSLFLFVSSQRNHFAVICQHSSRRSFLSSMSTPEKKVSRLLYFFEPWRNFSPGAGCLLCILPSQGGVGRQWWPGIFWEIDPHSYLWILYIVRKKVKSKAGTLEKRLKNILCKPMNSDPHRNLPCHTAFLFFHQSSCLLKRRGHLLQFCTVIQSVCTNCYGFSRVNVCRYLFLFVTLFSLTCSPSAVYCCQPHWKPSSEDISLEWTVNKFWLQ